MRDYLINGGCDHDDDSDDATITNLYNQLYTSTTNNIISKTTTVEQQPDVEFVVTVLDSNPLSDSYCFPHLPSVSDIIKVGHGVDEVDTNPSHLAFDNEDYHNYLIEYNNKSKDATEFANYDENIIECTSEYNPHVSKVFEFVKQSNEITFNNDIDTTCTWIKAEPISPAYISASEFCDERNDAIRPSLQQGSPFPINCIKQEPQSIDKEVHLSHVFPKQQTHVFALSSSFNGINPTSYSPAKQAYATSLSQLDNPILKASNGIFKTKSESIVKSARLASTSNNRTYPITSDSAEKSTEPIQIEATKKPQYISYADQSHRSNSKPNETHRRFICPDCNSGFRQQSSLVQHRVVHSAARPYRCEYCTRTYNRVSTLIAHRRTHQVEKQFRCPLCPKGFHQKGNLRNHIYVHTGERPYQCERCDKRFNQMSNLNFHRQRQHADDTDDTDTANGEMGIATFPHDIGAIENRTDSMLNCPPMQEQQQQQKQQQQPLPPQPKQSKPPRKRKQKINNKMNMMTNISGACSSGLSGAALNFQRQSQSSLINNAFFQRHAMPTMPTKPQLAHNHQNAIATATAIAKAYQPSTSFDHRLKFFISAINTEAMQSLRVLQQQQLQQTNAQPTPEVGSQQPTLPPLEPIVPFAMVHLLNAKPDVYRIEDLAGDVRYNFLRPISDVERARLRSLQTQQPGPRGGIILPIVATIYQTVSGAFVVRPPAAPAEQLQSQRLKLHGSQAVLLPSSSSSSSTTTSVAFGRSMTNHAAPQKRRLPSNAATTAATLVSQQRSFAPRPQHQAHVKHLAAAAASVVASTAAIAAADITKPSLPIAKAVVAKQPNPTPIVQTTPPTLPIIVTAAARSAVASCVPLAEHEYRTLVDDASASSSVSAMIRDFATGQLLSPRRASRPETPKTDQEQQTTTICTDNDCHTVLPAIWKDDIDVQSGNDDDLQAAAVRAIMEAVISEGFEPDVDSIMNVVQVYWNYEW